MVIHREHEGKIRRKLGNLGLPFFFLQITQYKTKQTTNIQTTTNHKTKQTKQTKTKQTTKQTKKQKNKMIRRTNKRNYA